MLHNDQIGLAVHLSRIELKQSAPSAQLYEAEFQHFLRAQVGPPPVPCVVEGNSV